MNLSRRAVTKRRLSPGRFLPAQRAVDASPSLCVVFLSPRDINHPDFSLRDVYNLSYEIVREKRRYSEKPFALKSADLPHAIAQHDFYVLKSRNWFSDFFCWTRKKNED